MRERDLSAQGGTPDLKEKRWALSTAWEDEALLFLRQRLSTEPRGNPHGQS